MINLPPKWKAANQQTNTGRVEVTGKATAEATGKVTAEATGKVMAEATGKVTAKVTLTCLQGKKKMGSDTTPFPHRHL